LAALNEIECARDPQRAFIINSLGTLNLLIAAEQVGVNKFIYFSTAHVYGEPLQGFISESSVCRPVHPYAITHKSAEDFVLAARDKGRIDGIVVRLSNGIGAPAFSGVNRWTLVGNDLCRQAIRDQKIVLKSSGVQKRDFIALQDVCRAVKHLIGSAAISRTDGLFNLGGDCCLSISNIAEMVVAEYQKMTGISIKIERPEERVADKAAVDLTYCIEKIKSSGFAPMSITHDAIRETLESCEEWYGTNKG
jgi:UDP-glucose 4-epimerase